MNKEVGLRFDQFCPKLVSGKVVPFGTKLIFETIDRRRQIILPFELAELLVLCNGILSMKEIVSTIYKRQGVVHFRTLYNAVYYLKEKGFLENGKELNKSQSWPQYLSHGGTGLYQPFIEIFFGRSIALKRPLGWLFYIVMTALIVFGVLGVLDLHPDAFSIKFLRFNGSYLNGLFAVFILSSAFLTIKTVMKSLLLLGLTGRVFNLSLCISLFGVYFQVGNESQFLVSNKIRFSIMHLALVFSHMATAFFLNLIIPQSDLAGHLPLIAILLTLKSLNPFSCDRDTLFYFVSLSIKSDLNLLNNYFRNKNLNLFNIDLRNEYPNLLIPLWLIALSWATAVSYIVWGLIKENSSLVFFSLRSDPILEKMAAICIITLFFGSLLLISRDLVKEAFSLLKIPFRNGIYRIFRRFRIKVEQKFSSEDLINVLKELPLFSYLSDLLLNKVIDGSQLVSYPRHTRIILQGDSGSRLFVLLSGSLSVWRSRDQSKRDEQIGEILPPSIFGEIAVIEEVKRTSTVVADELSMILEIPAQLLRAASKESQYVREISDFKNAIMVSQYFHSAYLFRNLPQEIIDFFISRGKIEEKAANEEIFAQGSFAEEFYLLVRGVVGIYVNEVHVQNICQGEFFGEIALIGDIPRTATVRAIEKVLILKISKDSFWEILTENIEMALVIESVSEARLKESIQISKAMDLGHAKKVA